MELKGIVLAGGSGSRLYPLTRSVSKQLMPVYSKPLIYYPLSTLMLAGIREILIVTTPADQASFRQLLGSGEDFGVTFSYAVQPSPDGLAQAFSSGASSSYGQSRPGTRRQHLLRRGPGGSAAARGGAGSRRHRLWLHREGSGTLRVVELDREGRPVSLEEKPKHPRSPYAVTGLYFYDTQVVDIAASLEPARGELEITDVNRATSPRDAHGGTGRPRRRVARYRHVRALLQAANFVQSIEDRQGLMIAGLEGIAWRLGWIDAADVERLGRKMQGNHYGQYLLRIVPHDRHGGAR